MTGDAHPTACLTGPGRDHHERSRSVGLQGLPIGIQVVASPWREDVALAAAAHLEKTLGGWQRPLL